MVESSVKTWHIGGMDRKEYTGLSLDETTFWAYTRLVDWRDKCQNKNKTDMAKVVFFLLLPNEDDMNAYRARYAIIRKNLEKAISAWEEDNDQLPVSDDGFDDLLNHIIGLGEEEYRKNVENPKLAFDRADHRDYVESFAYCIPYPGDYARKEREQANV